jgi:hypothetical protein
MAIDLVGKDARFYFSNHGWEETLLLAQDYGWIPIDAPDDHWERFYFSNDGYVISARDAEALASSLRQALPHLPLQEHRHLQDFIDYCRKGEFRIE